MNTNIEGELYKQLIKAGKFSEPTAAKFVGQVADALDYCHFHNVIHRDIKPENILCNFSGDIKLADFGWSVHSNSRRATMCGTPDYLAPEIVTHREHDKTVDNWTVGILAYEFLVGSPPFECDDMNETYQRIVRVQYTFPREMPEAAKNLISGLIRYNPKNRISLESVVKHIWVQSNTEKKITYWRDKLLSV